MTINELGEYSENIRKALRSILSDGSSLLNLKFGESIEEKRILFFYGFPDNTLLTSFCSASIAISEYEVYIIRLTMYERESNLDSSFENHDLYMFQHYRQPFLWKLSCDSPDDLYGDNIPSELKSTISMDYAIVSQNGRWGIIKPIGPIAFLAGDEEYFSFLFKQSPELRNHVFDFLKYVKNMYDDPSNQLNIEAVRNTLRCVYDEEQTNILVSAILVS